MLDAETARALLSYDHETGALRWKPRPVEMFVGGKMCAEARCAAFNSRWAGKIAGTPDGKGYLSVLVLGKAYRAHRVAWLIMTGEWPPDEIDHEDGKRSANRFSNLREATPRENRQNRCVQKNNSSGVTGVGWCNRKRKFRARIMVSGREKHLGYFDTLNAAIAAREEAKPKYHPFHPIDRREYRADATEA